MVAEDRNAIVRAAKNPGARVGLGNFAAIDEIELRMALLAADGSSEYDAEIGRPDRR